MLQSMGSQSWTRLSDFCVCVCVCVCVSLVNAEAHQLLGNLFFLGNLGELMVLVAFQFHTLTVLF